MDKLRTKQIFDILQKSYPDAHCELNFTSNYELLIAVMLSAQCTDKRVNLVTPKLFKIAPTPQKMVLLSQEQVEEIIRSCGFYHQKAKSILSASDDILSRFDGQVPASFEKLLTLRGVGRKTANVVMSVAFGGDNIAVDTHVFRTSHRLGLSNGRTPFDVEKDLLNLIDDSKHLVCHHLLIFHGRYCCKSRSPECNKCSVNMYCKEFSLENNQI